MLLLGLELAAGVIWQLEGKYAFHNPEGSTEGVIRAFVGLARGRGSLAAVVADMLNCAALSGT